MRLNLHRPLGAAICVVTILTSALPGVAMADDKADDKSTAVTVDVVIPAKIESFDKHKLDVRLFAIHPRLADAAATQVDKVVKDDVAHQAGKDTTIQLQLGKDKKLDPGLTYYVTCFLLDSEEARTHMGEIEGKPGLSKVLTGGNPRQIKLTVRKLK